MPICLDETISGLTAAREQVRMAIEHIKSIDAGFDALMREYAADECPWVAGDVDAERAERWECCEDCERSIYDCWKRLFIERGTCHEG